jgi:filamentous hemagglutinin
LSGGRTAYYDESTNTVIIVNPKAIDDGAAFRLVNGRAYFDNLR